LGARVGLRDFWGVRLAFLLNASIVGSSGTVEISCTVQESQLLLKKDDDDDGAKIAVWQQ